MPAACCVLGRLGKHSTLSTEEYDGSDRRVLTASPTLAVRTYRPVQETTVYELALSLSLTAALLVWEETYGDVVGANKAEMSAFRPCYLSALRQCSSTLCWLRRCFSELFNLMPPAYAAIAAALQ